MGKKKPTREQKKHICAAGLRSQDYLVLFDMPNSLSLVHRKSGEITVIEKKMSPPVGAGKAQEHKNIFTLLV